MNALVTNVINNVFHAIWLCCIIAEPKCSRKKTVLIVAGTTLLCQGIALVLLYLRASGMVPYGMVSTSITYLIGYVIAVVIYGIMFCFFVSASHPVKSMFLLSGYFSIWASSYGIISVVTNTYTGAGNAAIWGLRIGLNLVLLISYLLFVRERLFQLYKEIESGYWMISTLSVICFVMQTLFLFYNDKVRDHEPLYVVLFISASGFMVAVYVMIFRYMAQSDRANRMKQMQANEKFLQAQIDSYKKMGENARQTRHDFRHHSMVVMEYAKNKDYQGILSYLQEYEERENEKFADTFCKNRAVDTVLSAYVSRCAQNDIEIDVKVWLDETLGVTDYDLVTILANILENAVNGCMEVEGRRSIEISIGQKENKLIMVCKNTCVPVIRFENGLPKNRQRDGIGVKSVLNTVVKYGGVVDFSAEDGIFVCRTILSSRKNK